MRGEMSKKSLTLFNLFQHVSRNIYRGYLELLKLVVEGYESSMKFKGLGGLGSVFPFLEVSHRYYCGKKYLDESNDTSMSSSSSRKSSLVDSIKESSSHLESSTDRESDSSLHYHRGNLLICLLAGSNLYNAASGLVEITQAINFFK